MIENTVNAPTKPARSPVERALVWGVILLGLVVVGVEAYASFAAENAKKALQAKLDAVEAGAADSAVTQDDVDKVVAGRKPISSEKLDHSATAMMADRVDIYDFKGLVRSRQLYVYYGIEGKGQKAEVMDVLTSPAETLDAAMAKLPKLEPSAQSTDGATPPAGGPMGPGPMGAGAPPMGGAGPMGAGGPMGGRRPAGEDTPKTDAPAEKKEEGKPAATAEEPKKEEPKTEAPKEEVK